MTILATPSDETLLKYAAGTLDPGIAIVLRAHLEIAPETRARLARFEAVGGVLLHDEDPVPLIEGSLERALAAIDRLPAAPGTAAIRRTPRAASGEKLPASLEECEIGRWRWIGPGVHLARVGGVEHAQSRVMLMRFAAGARMLEHSHDGVETTFVIKGSFSDEGGRFGAGSYIEADESIEHQPVVDPDMECICLVAMQGHIRAPFPMGLIARYLMGV